MKRVSRSFAVLTAAMLALVTAHTAFADHDGGKNNGAAETRLKTKLTGAAIQGKTPEGSADFRKESNRSRLNVEVENVNLPAGTVLTVSLNGTAIGTITLSALGVGELELESEHGATVPAVQKGDIVTVSNGTTAILAGVF